MAEKPKKPKPIPKLTPITAKVRMPNMANFKTKGKKK